MATSNKLIHNDDVNVEDKQEKKEPGQCRQVNKNLKINKKKEPRWPRQSNMKMNKKKGSLDDLDNLIRRYTRKRT